MKARRPSCPKWVICLTALVNPCLISAGELTATAPVTYDLAYPALAYSAPAEDNAVANLLDRLARREISLAYEEPRGYLDALLKAMDISPASQVLVFSRTSLQASFISSGKPRAIYFNDHTYVAWVQGSTTLEVLTIDSQRGPVFFTFHNAPGNPLSIEREAPRCMACHDSLRMRPGGIPKVMLLSSPIDGQVNPPLREGPAEVTHAMAIEDRWGGWFVTGSLGSQLHVGNLPLAGTSDPAVRNIHNRSNLNGLQGHIDATPYITDKSDIVALLTLEHQAYVQNLITHARYESSTIEETAHALRWSDLPPQQQSRLQPALDRLITAITFQDERKLLGRIRGGAGFESKFTAQGPADAQGRSLREFDLRTRTYKYPLSYLVYSKQFDGLPSSLKDYVYRQIVVVCRTPSGDGSLDADRRAALEILAATKPEFAAWL